FAVLRQAGVAVGGMEVVVTGDVPLGAGLGSSAALETAVAMLILRFHPHSLDTLELAKLLQRGENQFTGVRCGLLDQFSVLHGREDRVIFLHCGTDAHETLILGRSVPAIIICNSGVSRALGQDAPYNLRRAECEQAAMLLGRLLGRPVRRLCEISSAELATVTSGSHPACGTGFPAGRNNQLEGLSYGNAKRRAEPALLPEVLLSRARHVIEEHERVLAARDLLRRGMAHRLGPLLAQSHESSRALFENSCVALDRLCTAAAHQPGCLGTRLCGAGWGGCTVTLVAPDAVDAFLKGMSAVAGASRIEVCYASDGARGWHL
ncbi:MAG: hypothetical protein V2A79_02430, partial [Planctomycetota bacterium]